MKNLSCRAPYILIVTVLLYACTNKPVPGPDKQFGEAMEGAASGAGAGAITGFQIGSGTGPGALIGAGMGAVAGGIRGYGHDQAEQDLLKFDVGSRREREVAFAHELLTEHYKRRTELHPTRDIFPADWFFNGDDVKLRREAIPLVRELARLNSKRSPWSRLVVAAYAKSSEEQSAYAKHLTQRRAREICDYLSWAGLEARRLQTRAVVTQAPVLIDPYDNPARYNQAIEIIAVDR